MAAKIGNSSVFCKRWLIFNELELPNPSILSHIRAYDDEI